MDRPAVGDTVMLKLRTYGEQLVDLAEDLDRAAVHAQRRELYGLAESLRAAAAAARSSSTATEAG
jgi:hypothetical protein